MADVSETVEELFTRCRADHAAWINGDPSGYTIPEDGTLMGAFGGVTHGGEAVGGRQRSAASLWESGTGDVELVDGGVVDGVAWMVMIERASVRFAGRAEPTRWDLRVTELFRHSDDGWTRFHRHADPLLDFHRLDEVLALLG
jgi:hypothetical protein